MAKQPKLGTGERFATLTEKLATRKVGVTPRGKKMAKALPGRTGKVKNAPALAAWLGVKKYGQKKMTQMAVAGRKAKSK